jgi:hypothetical protein
LGHLILGEIQPLLVTLHNINQAKQLITNSRQLSESTNVDIKNKIVINPKLTSAEAAAAYQLRVQRRAAAQHRSEQQSQRHLPS